MATERDNAFSTGTGGMNQGTDFGSQGLGAGTGGAAYTTESSGQSEPATARARGAVTDAGHKAAERVQERIADQMHRATGQLETVASSLRSASEQMPEETMGRYMMQAATQVDNLATFLNNREVSEIVDEVEDFARRQPAVFIGGAFALGVLGARFLRSSRHQLERDGHREWRSDSYSDGYMGQTNGETRRTEPLGMTQDYQRNAAYGTGYMADRGGDSSLRSPESFQASGIGGTDRQRSQEGLGTGRDYASDRPDRPAGSMTGNRPERAGTGSLDAGSRTTRESGSSGSTRSSTSNPLLDEGTEGRSTRRLDASPGSSSSGLSGRSDSTTDQGDRSRSDGERRDGSQSPDYL